MMTPTDDWLVDFLATERLPASYAETVEAVALPLAEQIAAKSAGPRGVVVGVCGAQASGKSTLTVVVKRLLEMRGLKVALFSLDDIYLTRAERQALAAEVHPLLATRGVPGTHDIAWGEVLLEDLRKPGRTLLPAFDKASDDRKPGVPFEGPADVVLFEGWCVGAAPQAPAALVQPINDLERDFDPGGVWRTYANTALAGPYRDLFSKIDMLVLLQAPGFDVVLDWRVEQERKLRERLAREGGDESRVMSDDQVEAFIRHYERLTRWILEEMPRRADIVVRLDKQRRASL
jgi:D-glycerate 3-kinase